ncbi:MAG: RsmD family RNA methyltransferase, partial [Pseudomonadota bacterium]
APRQGASRLARASLVFLDPPYGKDLGSKAIIAATAGDWIAPGATIIWEESAPIRPPEGFAPLDARVYGTTHVSIFRYAP